MEHVITLNQLKTINTHIIITNQEPVVCFVWKYNATLVSVWGSFNNWSRGIPLFYDSHSGVWIAFCDIHPSVVQEIVFVFLVDSHWNIDEDLEWFVDGEDQYNTISLVANEIQEQAHAVHVETLLQQEQVQKQVLVQDQEEHNVLEIKEDRIRDSLEVLESERKFMKWKQVLSNGLGKGVSNQNDVGTLVGFGIENESIVDGFGIENKITAVIDHDKNVESEWEPKSVLVSRAELESESELTTTIIDHDMNVELEWEPKSILVTRADLETEHALESGTMETVTNPSSIVNEIPQPDPIIISRTEWESGIMKTVMNPSSIEEWTTIPLSPINNENVYQPIDFTSFYILMVIYICSQIDVYTVTTLIHSVFGGVRYVCHVWILVACIRLLRIMKLIQ
jgi:hypothetical protein